MDINTFCLFVGESGNGSVELLGCELTLINFIRREGDKQCFVLDTITTVKRVVSFVVMYAALVGLFCFAVFFKDVNILEKFDLKVSTLYIAQIKKKCGIELREHYNKSKKEKQVIPQCTPEKEEAIMDALKHFKMI